MSVDQFEYCRLPLLVQELVTEKIINGLHYSDWHNFALTSKKNYSLVRRFTKRKLIRSCSLTLLHNKSEIYHGNQTSVITFSDSESLINYLKNILIADVFEFSINLKENEKVEDFERIISELSFCARFTKSVEITVTKLDDPNIALSL